MDTPLETILSGLVRRISLQSSISAEDVETGIEQLKDEALLLVAEMSKLSKRKILLSNAVFSDDFPYLTRIHGAFRDFLNLDASSDIAIAFSTSSKLVQQPEVEAMLDYLARLSFASENHSIKLLTRFLLFELLCFSQRVVLLAEDIDLRSVQNDDNEIELLAEREMSQLENNSNYCNEVLSSSHPFQLIMKSNWIALDLYLEDIKLALLHAEYDYLQAFEKRTLLIKQSNYLDAVDRVVLLNKLKNPPISAKQLKRRHPLILRELSTNAIHKRSERLPAKMRENHNTVNTPRVPTLGELICTQAKKLTAESKQ